MEARGNSFANGQSTHNGSSHMNGPWAKPQGSASTWDHLEPGLPA